MKKRLLLILVGLCLAVAAASWARTLAGGLPWSVYLQEVGGLLALLGFILLFFQYVLISRIKFIEKGRGLDKLIGMHKPLGVLLLLTVTLHPLLIFISERLQGYSTPIGFVKIVGVIALLTIWVTAGSALIYGRINLRYESWKRIHRAGYIILPLALFHSLFLGSTLQPGFLRGFWVVLGFCYAAVLAARIHKHYAVKRYPLKVSHIKQETYDTWSLDIEGDHPDYAPGQFMLLRLKIDGIVSSPHPFTLSSSPTRKGLSVCIKSVGDFTSRLSENLQLDQAFVDMPYGVFSFLNHDAERYIFIAGGIGITPFLSMLRFMKDKKLNKQVILIWGNKEKRDIAFKAEIESMASQMTSFKVVHVLSREKEWLGEKGHIDAEKLKRQVGDFTKGEFFVCGPPRMMKDLEKALLVLGVKKGRIHTERFSLR
jgi:predicted ferric reductase